MRSGGSFRGWGVADGGSGQPSAIHAAALQAVFLMRMLVDNEQLCADGCAGAVRFRMVSDLIAHARAQHERTSVFEFCVQLAL